jgi:hypothetical protein
MKKADEMEMAINYRAARCGFFFLEIALLVYAYITFATTGQLPSVPLIMCSAGGAVFWFMKIYATHVMTKDNTEDEE